MGGSHHAPPVGRMTVRMVVVASGAKGSVWPGRQRRQLYVRVTPFKKYSDVNSLMFNVTFRGIQSNSNSDSNVNLRICKS